MNYRSRGLYPQTAEGKNPLTLEAGKKGPEPHAPQREQGGTPAPGGNPDSPRSQNHAGKAGIGRDATSGGKDHEKSRPPEKSERAWGP